MHCNVDKIDTQRCNSNAVKSPKGLMTKCSKSASCRRFQSGMQSDRYVTCVCVRRVSFFAANLIALFSDGSDAKPNGSDKPVTGIFNAVSCMYSALWIHFLAHLWPKVCACASCSVFSNRPKSKFSECSVRISVCDTGCVSRPRHYWEDMLIVLSFAAVCRPPNT